MRSKWIFALNRIELDVAKIDVAAKVLMNSLRQNKYAARSVLKS